MLPLAYAAYLESGAEAVMCIANQEVTWQVVHGLERRDTPAFGPIWHSWPSGGVLTCADARR